MDDARDSTISAMRRTGLHRVEFTASAPGEYLPREQARCCSGNCNQGRSCPSRQARELPEPDAAWAWIDALIKPAAKYGATVLATAVALALILSPYFLNR